MFQISHQIQQKNEEHADLFQFFNTVKYIIGGYEYSLQDIENGVLRANRKGVGMLTRPFSKSDPRLAVALETHEPLIHFGLVCGAKSCPPIKTYTADVSFSYWPEAAFPNFGTICHVRCNLAYMSFWSI